MKKSNSHLLRPNEELSRPLEITVTSIFLCGAGLIYTIFPLFALTLYELTIESLLVVSGISLVLATIGLWYGRQWWLFYYGLFVGIRAIVRFSDDVLDGSFTSILKYVVLTLFWILLGFRMWKMGQ
jgi:hypothetical protein